MMKYSVVLCIVAFLYSISFCIEESLKIQNDLTKEVRYINPVKGESYLENWLRLRTSLSKKFLDSLIYVRLQYNYNTITATGSLNLQRCYIIWNFNEVLQLFLGKTRFDWGVGYAWSPTNYLNPIVNPADPSAELIYEEETSIIGGYVFLYPSEIMIAVVPKKELHGNSYAIRFKRLFHNLDISIMSFFHKETLLIGGNFTLPVAESFLLKGDFSTNKKKGYEYLIGVDYVIDYEGLFKFFLEYHFRSTGYSTISEYLQDLYSGRISFIRPGMISKNYISFGTSYVTSGRFKALIFLLYNINDQSCMFVPRIDIPIHTHSFFYVIGTFPVGSAGSEFPIFLNKYEIEMRFRVFF